MIKGNQIDTKILDKYIAEFMGILGLSPDLNPKYLKSLGPYLNYLKNKDTRKIGERKKHFISLINKKFELNSKAIADLYEKAADLGYTFNFHQKNLIQKSFDSTDLKLLSKIFKDRNILEADTKKLEALFYPVSEQDTIKHIHDECVNPSKLRNDRGGRNIKNEILEALFSAFLWCSLETEEMHAYFDPQYSENNYKQSFWEQLHSRSAGLFNRDNTLSIIKIDQRSVRHLKDIQSIRNSCINIIPPAFRSLNNFGFLAVVIENIKSEGRDIQWEIASDLILSGEKFLEAPLDKNYFQWKKIREETLAYVGKIDDEITKFDLVNEGFIYKDTFVLTNNKEEIDRILVLFQKNERDETPIPCPSCRSMDIQGNSYSSLGVKSWECNNPFCPDRTKYNRGKRYSFKNLLMQQAIEEDRNTIPKESIKRWRRDVVKDVKNDEITEMLVRHYSMHGDSIHIYNWESELSELLGRKFISHDLKLTIKHNNFFNSHFFNRFVVQADKKAGLLQNLGDEVFQLYKGDAAEVLRSIKENSIDGAVTSPPYYNAREYSQWKNMYCYLFDMLDINKELFETLKPGGIYLYNIFDYFDNEKIVASSAMAQKRMILSAYTVDLFRRIGFQMLGNIVWDKGDIEGKRGFNAGNFSPFYQSPFNCWEHVLIFQKPNKKIKSNDVSESIVNISKKVFFCKPVMKMIGGKNTHGHTAPYPEELPRILTSLLPKGSTILDPFGGSLTTGRVAEKDGIVSINIELSEEYCRLGLQKRKELKASGSVSLFKITA